MLEESEWELQCEAACALFFFWRFASKTVINVFFVFVAVRKCNLNSQKTCWSTNSGQKKQEAGKIFFNFFFKVCSKQKLHMFFVKKVSCIWSKKTNLKMAANNDFFFPYCGSNKTFLFAKASHYKKSKWNLWIWCLHFHYFSILKLQNVFCKIDSRCWLIRPEADRQESSRWIRQLLSKNCIPSSFYNYLYNSEKINS